MAKVDSRKTRLSRKPGKTGSREKLIAGLDGALSFGFVPLLGFGLPYDAIGADGSPDRVPHLRRFSERC